MNSIEHFVDSIHLSHIDNAQNFYTAKRSGRTQHPVSPLTNFVFEFFLFNSLYSIDWVASMECGVLVHHEGDGSSESKMQRALVKFCRGQSEAADCWNISEAFLPLAGLGSLSGDWTKITPDSRVTERLGDQFFSKINQLGELAIQGKLRANKKSFDLIDQCCYFVYLVRNNIFHGAKSLGEIHDRHQAQRISVYDLFVRCLNSLFFLAIGKEKYGSAFAQLPIVHSIGSEDIHLSLQTVCDCLHRGLLRPEDSFLHWKLLRGAAPALMDSSTRRALFYPAAGRDVLFPLIAGIPYCTDFYFYEMVPGRKGIVPSACRTLNLTTRQFDSGDDACLGHEFEFDGISRRIWIMHKDSKAFLDVDIPLAFYFRRGDSEGEGGSGQRWDSDLLPLLAKRSCADAGMMILTDGEPGGLPENVKSQLQQVSPSSSHRGRDYFFGVFNGGSFTTASAVGNDI